jgi:hypothetical protein
VGGVGLDELVRVDILHRPRRRSRHLAAAAAAAAGGRRGRQVEVMGWVAAGSGLGFCGSLEGAHMGRPSWAI